MIKTKFLNELSITSPRETGSRGTDVKKIQEWLRIQASLNPGVTLATGIDGSFGPATKACIENFQRLKGLPINGKVNNAVFAKLCEPMQLAYNFRQSPPGNLRQIVCATAIEHQMQSPVELNLGGIGNMGPWVRAYCNGKEGNDMFWCMGFVQTIFDQSFETLGGNSFTTLMPSTLACTDIGLHAKKKGKLIGNEQVRKNPAVVQPGDIFLLRESENQWHHTGIILGVQGDVFETIEGNSTTISDSNNGFGVFRKIRNFRKKTLDVFPIT